MGNQLHCSRKDVENIREAQLKQYLDEVKKMDLNDVEKKKLEKEITSYMKLFHVALLSQNCNDIKNMMDTDYYVNDRQFITKNGKIYIRK